MLKRLMDLSIAFLLLVALSIPMLITALAVAATMGRPVLFRQVRPGLRGRPFELMKFRTMTAAADGSGAPLADEARLPTARLGAESWPNWRGPQLNGTSTESGLPVRWSVTENVTWKTPMPERSGSTPIVWGDHVFVSVGEGANLALWALDRANGAVRWKRPLGAGNRRMMKQQMSSPSPVTDGRMVEEVDMDRVDTSRSVLVRLIDHQMKLSCCQSSRLPTSSRVRTGRLSGSVIHIAM